jgi:hypothetical protein
MWVCRKKKIILYKKVCITWNKVGGTLVSSHLQLRQPDAFYIFPSMHYFILYMNKSGGVKSQTVWWRPFCNFHNNEMACVLLSNQENCRWWNGIKANYGADRLFLLWHLNENVPVAGKCGASAVSFKFSYAWMCMICTFVQSPGKKATHIKFLYECTADLDIEGVHIICTIFDAHKHVSWEHFYGERDVQVHGNCATNNSSRDAFLEFRSAAHNAKNSVRSLSMQIGKRQCGMRILLSSSRLLREEKLKIWRLAFALCAIHIKVGGLVRRMAIAPSKKLFDVQIRTTQWCCGLLAFP